MGKKVKEEELNFVFFDSNKKAQNNKHMPNRAGSVPARKKESVGTSSARPAKKQTTKKQTVKTKSKVNTQKKTSKRPNSKSQKQREQDIKKMKKIKLIANIIKWIILLGMLAGAMIFFMLTPLFNVKSIIVSGNSKLSSQTIITESNIELEDNTFKTNKNNIINSLKQNPYIRDVKVKRILPSTISIEIKERHAKFSIQYIGGYMYIDEQGYLLEKSGEDLVKLMIIGIKTPIDQLELGNRLIDEDLKTLEVVNKVIESSKSNEIHNLITKIDISDKENIILHLEDEDKTVEIGNGGDLNTKMLHISKILERERGKRGIIVINQDVNKVNPYFREEV